MESRTKKSAKNIVFSILFQLITIGSNFVVKTAFIRFMGIQYAGMSALFVDILGVLSLAELGFGMAISYALYAPLHTGDEKRIIKLLNYYKKIYRVVAAVVFGGGLICLPFLGVLIKDAPDIKENLALVFILFVLKTVASYLFIYKTTLLEANQEKNIISIVGIISTLIGTGAEVFAIAFLKNYVLYLVISVLVILFRNIAVSFVAEKRFCFLKGMDNETLTKEERKEITKDVAAVSIYKIGGTIQISADSIVISAMLGTVSVGLLSCYKLITSNVDRLFGQIFESMRASVGNLAVSADEHHQNVVFDRMCFLSFIIGNFICCATFNLITPFINIWLGKEYILGIEVVSMLVLDAYILTMTRPYENFRIANRLFHKGKYRPIFMTIINVILSIWFGKLWGIFGVLLATVIARVSTHVWYDPWLIYHYVFKKGYGKYLLTKAKYLLIIVFNCAIIYIGFSFVNISNIYIDFAARSIVSLVLPSVIVYALYRKSEEMNGLKRYIKNLIKK